MNNKKLVMLLRILIIITAISPYAFKLIYSHLYHKPILERKEALLKVPEERDELYAYSRYLWRRTNDEQAIFNDIMFTDKEATNVNTIYELERKQIELERIITGKVIDLEDPQVQQYLAEYRELVEQGVIEGR